MCANPSGDLEIQVRRLDPDVPLPSYAHPGDAGADLVTTVDVELAAGERAVVPTGLAIALPDGYAAFVHPRSGLAARCGVSIVNTPGTVDGAAQAARLDCAPRCGYRVRRQLKVLDACVLLEMFLQRSRRLDGVRVHRR